MEELAIVISIFRPNFVSQRFSLEALIDYRSDYIGLGSHSKWKLIKYLVNIHQEDYCEIPTSLLLFCNILFLLKCDIFPLVTHSQ